MKKLLVPVAVVFALSGGNAAADEVSLIAPGGIRDPIEKMIPDFERRTGHKVKATFGSGLGTKSQVMKGEVFDVPIVQPPLGEVTSTGHVVNATETPLATVAVAVAVRKGAPKPDISTPEAVKKMLLAAKTVASTDPRTQPMLRVPVPVPLSANSTV